MTMSAGKQDGGAGGGGSGNSAAMAASGWGGVAMAGSEMYTGMINRKAAKKAMKAQAEQAKLNARAEADAILQQADDRFTSFMERGMQLRTEAARLIGAGEERAQELRMEGNQMVSSIKASAAAHGIRRSGSPLEVAAEAAYVAEQQAGQVERDAAIQADAKLFDARQLQYAGQQESVAAKVAARTSLLRGNALSSSIKGKIPTVYDTIHDATRVIGNLDEKKIEYLSVGAKKVFSGWGGGGDTTESLNPKGGRYSSPRGSDFSRY